MCEPTIRRSGYCIHLEGNIGVGKSTFPKEFQIRLNDKIEVIEEPVHLWTNFRGTNLLNKMYSDPHRYSYPIQSYIQLTMARNECKPASKPIRIFERSLSSGRQVFTEAMRQLNYISQDEYNILDEWYEWLCSQSSLRTLHSHNSERQKSESDDRKSRLHLQRITLENR